MRQLLIKALKLLWRFIKWIFKMAWKLFLIALWGVLSLLEVILHHVNIYLKKINS